MGLSSSKLRVRSVWLIVVPFLWFARPTPELVAVGFGLAGVGLFVRAWAAGTIHKNLRLTTGGPYAHTRNPLYLGSFLIGCGVALAGGHWIWPVVFIAFFATIYRKTIERETRQLADLFPESYAAYAAAVPVFLPRLTPYRAEAGGGRGGFEWAQYLHNREWEALLGALAGFGVLTAKLLL